MYWKTTLYKLERLHEWDAAIALMEKVMIENPTCVDAYLSIAFLIMNFLGEERDYDITKFDDYILKITKCYEESKIKFSENPIYLYYMGVICWMCNLYFMGTFNENDINSMLQKAHNLDPYNMLYYYFPWQNPDITKESERNRFLLYSKEILDPQSKISKELAHRGSLGEYLLKLYKPWAMGNLKNIEIFLAGNLFCKQAINLLQDILRAPEISGNHTAREMLAKNIDQAYREQNQAFDMALRFFVIEKKTDFFTKEEAYQAIMDFLLQYYNEYQEKEILAFKNQLAEKKAVFEKYFMQVLHHEI